MPPTNSTQSTFIPSSPGPTSEYGMEGNPPPAWSFGLEASQDGAPPHRLASIYLSLDNRVFHLNAEILCRTSEALSNMFSIASQSNGPGTSLENPLVLDTYATSSQWNAFFSFIYPPHHSTETWTPPKQQHWIDLLAFGHQFQVPAAIGLAKSALLGGSASNPPGLMSPALQLYLGRTYRIPEWVEAAAPKVVATPFSTLPQWDYVYLGLDTVYRLVQLEARLTLFRQQLVMALRLRLTDHEIECNNTTGCTIAWQDTCNAIALLLIDPKNAWSECGIMGLLRSKEDEASNMRQMTPECADSLIVELSKSLKGRDESLIKETTNCVSKIGNF